MFLLMTWKLARGCGLKGDGLEQVVKLAFITGFPDHITDSGC